MKRIVCIFTLLLCLVSCAPEKEISETVVEEVRIPLMRNEMKSKPDFVYTFQQKYPDPQISQLKMIGTVGKYGVEGYQGKILRALRFKNISDAVEERYNLPDGIIFAMMAHESSGVDLLPNGRGDGGFGLSHMQSSIATDFGLKVYDNCTALVCDGKNKHCCIVPGGKANHAKKLTNELKSKGYDKKLLYHLDDRLHPILNLDAVGRMLAYHMDGNRIEDLGPFRTAIRRYAGKYNYRKYWKEVARIMKLANDPKFLADMEQDFNKINPRLRINGGKADFQNYILVMQQQNENYGLIEYRQLPKLLPKNSEIVKSTIHKFL